jgi:outer membrane protein assembly factor BamB
MPRGAVSAAPAVYQGLVFAGSRDGGVYAVRADTRANLWPGLEPGYFKTGGEILADLAADKDGVYVASRDSKLYRLDLNTGRVRWTYHSESPLREDSDPVPTTTHVFIFVRDKGLVAIDKSGPEEIKSPKWVLPEGRQFLASDEKYAYVRTDKNAIAAVDKATGKVAFSSRRPDFTHFATNTSDKDNNIYATTSGGLLYRVKPVLKPGTIGEWVMDFESAPVDTLATAR